MVSAPVVTVLAMDEPEIVAAQLELMLTAARMRDRNIGWPERLFLRINSIFPRIIDNALRGQLPIIRRHAQPAAEPVVSDRKIPEKLN